MGHFRIFVKDQIFLPWRARWFTAAFVTSILVRLILCQSVDEAKAAYKVYAALYLLEVFWRWSRARAVS